MTTTSNIDRPDTAGAQTSPFDADELIRLLSQQRDRYQQLKALCDQQAALIENGQSDALLALLGKRQVLVDELTELNATLTPLREALPQQRATLSPEQRRRINSLSDQVQELLSAILEQDDRDRKQLEDAKGMVGNQREQVARGGSALHAYRPTGSPSSPRFTDRKG